MGQADRARRPANRGQRALLDFQRRSRIAERSGIVRRDVSVRTEADNLRKRVGDQADRLVAAGQRSGILAEHRPTSMSAPIRQLMPGAR